MRLQTSQAMELSLRSLHPSSIIRMIPHRRHLSGNRHMAMYAQTPAIRAASTKRGSPNVQYDWDSKARNRDEAEDAQCPVAAKVCECCGTLATIYETRRLTLTLHDDKRNNSGGCDSNACSSCQGGKRAGRWICVEKVGNKRNLHSFIGNW